MDSPQIPLAYRNEASGDDGIISIRQIQTNRINCMGAASKRWFPDSRLR